MIKITNIVEPSSEQVLFAIQGMRNAKNSWSKSDSFVDSFGGLYLGDNDKKLMTDLRNAGSDHRKFMRQLPISMRITAPLYWWKEFDTYKVGTVSNSCSTMHKIADKEFTLEDFSNEHIKIRACVDNLKDTIAVLNVMRSVYISGGILSVDNFDGTAESKIFEPKDKDIWWQMIQLLPNSYNQTRNITMNYENALAMYRARKSHKLDEWRTFCSYLEILRYGFLIVDGDSDDNSYETCTATD